MPELHLISQRSTRWRTQVLALAVMLSVTACGDLGADDRPAPEQRSSEAFDQPGPKQNSGDAYELNIGSGPFAGTHRDTGDMGCNRTAGMWLAGLSRLERERGVSELSLMLTGVPATGGRTEEANFNVTFGQMHDESGNFGLLGIGGAVGGGAGRATVEREGRGAVIRIEGTTQAGAPISAVVRCRTVEFVD